MKKTLVALTAVLFLLGGAAAATPELSNPTPEDNATGVSTDASISLLYNHSGGDSGTVTFYSSKDVKIGEATSVSPGTRASVDPALSYGEELSWYAVASDGNSSTNNVTAGNFSFTAIESLRHIEDKVIDGTFTSQAFTPETLGNLTVNAALDTNESLEVTLKGYNSTEMTGNTSFQVSDGSNEYNVKQFTENTSTYVLEFNASNGSVVVNDARITGTTNSTNAVSGAAPGGGLLSGITGAFSAGISGAFQGVGSFLTEIVTGIGSWITGVIPV